MAGDPRGGSRANGPAPRRRWHRAHALAATLAAVVICGTAAYVASRVRAHLATSVPVPAASADPFAVDPAPITLSPSRLPALRATRTAAGGPFMADFGRAIQPYRTDDFGAAAALLDDLAREYPGVPEAQFYLGVARLLAGSGQDAVTPLERALADGDAEVRPLARWYLAFAYHGAGRDGEARQLFDRLCRNGRDPASRACELARTLRTPR